MPSLIRLTLLDDEPEGLRSAFVAGRTTVVVACPWIRLPALIARPDAARPGVYIFLGEQNDGDTPDAGEVAYVGECDAFAARIKSHHKADAAEWNLVLLATTTDGMFNKAHARRAEHLLTERAKRIGRVNLLNGGTSPGTLDPGDEAFVDEFVENIYTLSQTLGLTLFRDFTKRVSSVATSGQSRDDAKFVTEENNVIGEVDDAPTFEYSVNSAKAQMRPVGSQFILLSGSTLIARESDTMSGGARDLRQFGLDNGSIVRHSNGLLLNVLRDIPARSVSAAAQAVSGNSVNGKEMWKTAQGLTFKRWLSQRMRRGVPTFSPDDQELPPE